MQKSYLVSLRCFTKAAAQELNGCSCLSSVTQIGRGGGSSFLTDEYRRLHRNFCEANMQKQIQYVNQAGIDYIDEEGNLRHIDFESCYNNWLAVQNQRNDPYHDDRSRQIVKEWKCVGQRDRYANLPYIEFFTEPIIRFEFKSLEECFHDLRRKIEKAGWRISDLG